MRLVSTLHFIFHTAFCLFCDRVPKILHKKPKHVCGWFWRNESCASLFVQQMDSSDYIEANLWGSEGNASNESKWLNFNFKNAKHFFMDSIVPKTIGGEIDEKSWQSKNCQMNQSVLFFLQWWKVMKIFFLLVFWLLWCGTDLILTYWLMKW